VKKTDSRIIKTRKALNGALFKLLKEKSFNSITINELCATSGIRRATFYKHFKDKYEFLCFVIKSLRESFDDTVWQKDTPGADSEYYISYANVLVRFLYLHKDVVRNIIKDSTDLSFVGILIKQNLIATKEKLDQSIHAGLTLKASTEVTAGMLSGGIAVIILRWFEGGNIEPIETIIEEITTLIKEIIN